MADGELEDLLARCGLGDRDAFVRLYGLCSAKLFGVALRILGNRSDAEDVVQESCVKIWHNAGQFSAARGSAAAWMVSIARNQAIDRLRARKAPARDVATMAELADTGPSPEAMAMGSDDRRRIQSCLGELPRDRALAVRAAYVEGYSYEELSRAFEVPLNTMRTWLRRALLSLRECMSR